MKLKVGVRLKDLQPQMVLAALIVERIFVERGGACTITSANDSTHSATSWHYKGRALDFRTHDFPGDKQELLAALKAELDSDFDILLESLGGPQEHIHVEYDPK